METGNLNLDREIKSIMGHIKNLIFMCEEWGLAPPELSEPTLTYLEDGPDPIRSLDDLRRFVGDCKRCRLSHGRTHLVFGEGSHQARLVFVGEGPGREEDREGSPFVGEAGKLLTKIIHAMGLTREDVYICNVVKCRPPGNRNPEPDEIRTCIPFLKKQLRMIRPQVICTLGLVAIQGLMGSEFLMKEQRGKWLSCMDIPLMPTYHPAYLLRNPSAKRPVWEDVQKIMGHLGLEVKRND